MMYENEVVYQIYPLTFCDSNKDGVGDIKGIISKLNYLKKLGVTYLWLCPVTKSPMRDNGYDVSDFYNINELFGTNEDYEKLIEKAKEKKMKIMMDMVMNHTSDEHDWFKKSVEGIKPFDKYYVWRKKPVPGFSSQFENDCWTFNEKRGEYYLHQFSKHQPDLNWENPAILEEFRKIIKYWVGKGIRGFRFDVVDMIGKQIDKGIKIDTKRSFELLEKLGDGIFTKNKILTVGECWSTGRNEAVKYTNKNNAILTTIFNARYMFLFEDGSRWKHKVMSEPLLREYRDWMFSQNEIMKDSQIPNFVENHDFPRVVSRFWNDEKNIFEKSKLFFTIHYLRRGVNFLYQGQELGLPNAKYKSTREIDDVETKKLISDKYDNIKEVAFGTRDNSRKPFPWTGHEKNSYICAYKYKNEFTPKFELIDPNSPLNFWKKIIKIRLKYSSIFADGKMTPFNVEDGSIFAYTIDDKSSQLMVITSWMKSVTFDTAGYKCLYSQNYDGKTLKKLGIFIGIKEKTSNGK